ncbi:hypothetical protein [Sphingobacterium sp. CZ-2]|uniref:hypothetical protein n=1 Tax=Sphingobacterium sp. CZ-2 TaxID=2557994 RepID=UPI001070415C|nr:hypothetical protein [Sphingobacterium sp. CZ-2]QBR11601.1 hypothetical protein E3D81_05205 [Sphingobacterium sp. CZ-2]
MSGIKSLADELRDSMRKGKPPQAKEIPTEQPPKDTPKKKAETLEHLFDSILNHELTGRERLLIRLDDKTLFLLKQLKVAKGIDMNKIIAYSLHLFLKTHPEISRYIKEHIKTLDL